MKADDRFVLRLCHSLYLLSGCNRKTEIFCEWLEFQIGCVLSRLHTINILCFSFGNSVKMPRITSRYINITMHNDSNGQAKYILF